MEPPKACPSCRAEVKATWPRYTVYRCGTRWYNRVSIERSFKCLQAREVQLEKELAEVKEQLRIIGV